MTYKIKEIFFTQQGEGTNTGKDFVFVRFSGCNLWSGKEKNRASAICKFCDTDFYGTVGIYGGVYSAKELIKRVKSLWLSSSKKIRVLCTGGEPLLQLDSDLISAFKEDSEYDEISKAAVFTSLTKIQDFTKGNFRDDETKSHYQYLNWKVTNFLDGKVFNFLEK